MNKKSLSERDICNGEPLVIYEPKPDESVVPPDDLNGDDTPTDGDDFGDEDEPQKADPADDTGEGGGGTMTDPPPGKRTKYYVADVAVKVVSERVQYYGNDGKLITESLKDYTRKAVLGEFTSLDEFLQRWTTADRKQAVLTELEHRGVFFAELAEQVGKDFDPFDLICHVAFDQPPLTRRERADNVKKRNDFARYGEQAGAVLEALLDKYADEGIGTIETFNVLNVQPLIRFGTPIEIVRLFGGAEKYQIAVKELESALYALAKENLVSLPIATFLVSR